MCARLAEPQGPTPPEHEPGGIFSSHLARAARQVSDHLAVPEEPDAAERWGKRLGRTLSVVAFVLLAWYFGHQMNWWQINGW